MTHGHPPELGLSPSDKAKLATRRKVVPDNVYTVAITVQLVDDLLDDESATPSTCNSNEHLCYSRFGNRIRAGLNLR